MHKLLYLFSTIYLTIMLFSCEKGEKLMNYEELVNLQFSGLPTGTSVFREGQKLSLSGSSYKVPTGEASYRFEDNTGKVLLEQPLTVNASETITFFDTGDGLLLLKPLDDEAVNPTKLKFDIANLSSFSEGKEVNLIICRLNSQRELQGKADTLRNVKNTFTNEFYEINYGDFSNETEPITSYAHIYICDSNMAPYKKENLPIVYRMKLDFDDDGNGNQTPHKVYKVILKDEGDGRAYNKPTGLFEEGMYYYSIQPLLSK